MAEKIDGLRARSRHGDRKYHGYAGCDRPIRVGARLGISGDHQQYRERPRPATADLNSQEIKVMGDLPPISWASLALVVSCVGISGGALIACLLWVYRELNTLRAEIANFRVEVAHSYVNTGALTAVESRLEAAVNKLGDRLDRSIENLLNLLRADAIAKAKAMRGDDD